ncbi:aspartate ammonia-lyase [Nanoarchaeota archaeon]
MAYRTEKDVLGELKVPADAYFGVFTQRALKNFQNTKTNPVLPYPAFRQALGMVKKAASIVNSKLGVLEAEKSKAIQKAAAEFISGKYNEYFTLEPFQAGAGTPYNMNANEIIANRANEIMGGRKGRYNKVHPNNDVNMAQSTNDVIPTSMRISALIMLQDLYSEIDKLSKAFAKKAKEFKGIVKVGRTHYEDAVPITLEQEFNAYADQIARNIDIIKKSADELMELGIGGTATGTGINTHPKYHKEMCKELAKLTKFKLRPTKDIMSLHNNLDCSVAVSSSLKILAIDLFKIANDLSLLNSGPKAGFAELILPEVEPGSSIMPGKINPSICESVVMISFQVMGNDLTISNAAQYSVLQLNTMAPVIIHNLLQSIELLTNGSKMFRELCVDGIKANKDQIEKHLHGSLATATALNPYIGYQVTSELVHEALKKDISLKEVILKRKLIDKSDLGKILSANKMTKPGLVDKKIKENIQKSKRFKDFVKRKKL